MRTHESTIRRLYDEVVNGGKEDVAAELVDPAFVVHGDGTDAVDPTTGPEAILRATGPIKQACPDFAVHLQDVLVDGDRVAVRWTSSGTHTGPFMGAEPTGRAVSHGAVVIYRLADGKVVEMWPMVDRLGMMRQLGVAGV